MAPGSVIVDLAAERGGNCELTRAGETVIEHHVTILGPLNLAATVPFHASQLYARNLASFLGHLLRDGQLSLDLGDEITRETMVTRGGEVVHERVRGLLGLPPLPGPLPAGALPPLPPTTAPNPAAAGLAAAAGSAPQVTSRAPGTN